MKNTSKILGTLSLASMLALSACGQKQKETAASYDDGRCKPAMIGSYNAVGTSMKAYKAKLGEASKRKDRSGAEIVKDTEELLDLATKADANCKDLAANYGGMGACRAKDTTTGNEVEVSAEEKKDGCKLIAEQKADYAVMLEKAKTILNQ